MICFEQLFRELVSPNSVFNKIALLLKYECYQDTTCNNFPVPQKRWVLSQKGTERMQDYSEHNKNV